MLVLFEYQGKKMSETQQHGVLVADDEGEIRALVSSIFTLENFKVFQAVDGQSALETFTKHSAEIALVITDLGLPGLGGLELIEHVRRLKPSIRIISISGFGHQDVREKILKAGGDEFIAKPFVIDDLIRLARQLLRKP
jgi:DNA-binding response OmpR family regulator